ncbi:DUF2268 domain-containing protein [Neobacillus mesonae]|uniref:DUF2268 domain-containing protein n=1 Tax=Neobacillus mesonae TaxID=1193713 RepID=UPI00203B43CD|nr:DUF2268 domain-containing putative Zn-dependent protease [Neobacillus mesonae]MCM3570002.1 DUF2268 domain-containing protein [Neobacillus mesonae]
MGIIRTDEWLKKDFDHPVKICEKLLPYFKGENSSEIYNQLIKFGMYRPSWRTKQNKELMIKDKAWEQVEKIFSKYKDKWAGPDIPVFLFPLEQKGGLFFRREERNKAGVSFPDKMFLFLSHYDDPKELEALIVHEYHHVCRLKSLNRKMEDYTLLDSIIIEGLAEYAVLKHCGEEYLANWCHIYTEREMSLFWSRFLKEKLGKKKNERIHDELLYGGGRVPLLLGYAAGYNIVNKFYQTESYSTKLTFNIPATRFINKRNLFN